jgi:hypothetical protein
VYLSSLQVSEVGEGLRESQIEHGYGWEYEECLKHSCVFLGEPRSLRPPMKPC